MEGREVVPRKPKSSAFPLSIDGDFDDTKNYRVKLIGIEERQFPDRVALIWKLLIYREDDTVFEDPQTGAPFDQWAWSSDSTFKTSKGRGYTEAFMGREMTDEEIDELIDNGFEQGLVGKIARASFEIYISEDGNERLKVLLLRADKPNLPKRERREPVAATAPATPTRGRGQRIDDA